jgi:hypothetical protein
MTITITFVSKPPYNGVVKSQPIEWVKIEDGKLKIGIFFDGKEEFPMDQIYKIQID